MSAVSDFQTFKPEIIREAFFDSAGNTLPKGDPRIARIEVTFLDENGNETRTYLEGP